VNAPCTYFLFPAGADRVVSRSRYRHQRADRIQLGSPQPSRTPPTRSTHSPHAGVAERDIHLDTASGAKASRPKLDLVLQLLREGDTLVITRLDRLSPSVLHLITLGAELRERGIGLKVTEQGIDTTTVEGRAMFGMLSVLAELQRELIVANTHDGLAAARARGRTGGRRPMPTPDPAELAQQLYDARSKTVQQIAAIFGVPRTTVYGHLDKNTVGTRPRATRRG